MKKHNVSEQPTSLLQNKREREDVQERQHVIEKQLIRKGGREQKKRHECYYYPTNSSKKRLTVE